MLIFLTIMYGAAAGLAAYVHNWFALAGWICALMLALGLAKKGD